MRPTTSKPVHPLVLALGVSLLAFTMLAMSQLAVRAADGDAALNPFDVVAAQLQALQRNDDPAPDAGIARTFELAHPMNRAITGPLDRFAAMVKGPTFRPLINHRSHSIVPLERSETEAVFLVTVEGADGEFVEYRWVVAPDGTGRWLTTMVTPPLPGGASA